MGKIEIADIATIADATKEAVIFEHQSKGCPVTQREYVRSGQWQQENAQILADLALIKTALNIKQ